MQAAPRTRYSTVAQSFHWLTAIVVLIAFIFGPGGPEDRVYSAAVDSDRRLHETLGLIVIALTVLRVLWRLFDQRPATVPAARWMQLSARAVQGLLYLLLFAVPLTAIAGAWLAGLHAAAAIYHHAFLRDGVLVSMLPNRIASPATKQR